jgi:hypothetical protein
MVSRAIGGLVTRGQLRPLHLIHGGASVFLARGMSGTNQPALASAATCCVAQHGDGDASPVIVAAVGYADLNGSPDARTAQLLRWQADACRELGSPLYGDLLLHAADDLLAGGPTAEVLRGHLDDRLSSVLALRLLGGAHALALSGSAPQLAAFYPSAGGTADPEPGSPQAWAALRQTFAQQGDAIRTWLDHPPQTNEVGRAAALLGGLRHIAAEQTLPIRLIEVGASAGLNLRADRFYVPGDAGSYGDPESPVVLAGGWQGDAPPDGRIEVTERIGGDLSPVDPTTPHGRLRLTAFVWPDQADRLSRLRGAFTLAAEVPAELRAESASGTVARTELVPGMWTVLWHSIFRQYLSDGQREELASGVAALAATATSAARFAYLYLEQSRAGGCPVTLATWPGGHRRVLGSAPAHGLPVQWLAQT